MSDYIDLYDIHTVVLESRPECNNCISLRGSGVDAECEKYDTFTHDECPYIEAVINDVDGMIAGDRDELLVDFIDEIMELELSEEERLNINIEFFYIFIKENKDILSQKLTDFFSKRVSNENNYRSVLRD
ncbi:MAG: hypothetical protein ACTSV7_00630 [Candidatus Baldrarchaeia archaeon]